jgi:hypothetical protein
MRPLVNELVFGVDECRDNISDICNALRNCCINKKLNKSRNTHGINLNITLCNMKTVSRNDNDLLNSVSSKR